MFRLSESDYRKLEPIALKVYRGSARSAHVARLMESRVGRRALVDMMFLEEDQNGSEDSSSNFMKIIKSIKGEAAKILSGLRQNFNQFRTTENSNDPPISNNETEAKVSSFMETLKKSNEAAEYFKQESDELKARINTLGTELATANATIKNLGKDLFRESKRSDRYLSELMRSAKNTKQLQKIIKEANELRDDKLLNYIIEKAKEDPRFAKAFIKLVEDKKIEIDEKTKEAFQETLKFKNRVKFYFAKISKWFKGKLNAILKSIYSFFVEEGSEEGFTIKWAHVAIVVAVIAVIGFALFGPYGRQIRNFLFNALKGGYAAVKSAVRYVLGKSGAPKEVTDETESFLDKAKA